MSFHDREEKIMSILREKNSIRCSELAKLLYVSVSTLRRDLEKLEAKNLIVKEHGVCKISGNIRDGKYYYQLRERQENIAKNKIAKAAVELIKDGDVIMLEGSSTTFNMVQFLDRFEDLLVVSNSAKVSLSLGNMNIKNISTGGKMSDNTFSFVGQEAINTIKNYNADILFFSSMGLSEDGYFTDSNKEENDITKEMMKYATKKVALIDSSKIGKKYVYNLCHLTDVDEVICEEELPDYIKKCFWDKSK
jgi:DeoR/GlpR family transcriptional regulator of sugar metabolism